jgi:hypothetical protein
MASAHHATVRPRAELTRSMRLAMAAMRFVKDSDLEAIGDLEAIDDLETA